MYFEKVSKEAWMKQCNKLGISDEKANEGYDNIQIPARSTSGSCGYDFVCPMNMNVTTDSTTMIPTGIRACLDKGTFLMLCPRSSCTKLGYTMSNNVGIIDEDYYHADNEGNIMVALSSTGKITYVVKFKPGDKIAQGIIMPYLTSGDVVDTVRTGGFGSTGENIENKKEEPTIKPELDHTAEKKEESKRESDTKPIKDEEPNPVEVNEVNKTEDDGTETQVIQFNSTFSIYSNLINNIIVKELIKMINYAKLDNPTKYVSFIAAKNQVSSIKDIEALYNAVNEWYSSLPDPNIGSDVYARDAAITLTYKIYEIGEDEVKNLIESLFTIRSKGSIDNKLKAGRTAYLFASGDQGIDLNHLKTTLSDIISTIH